MEPGRELRARFGVPESVKLGVNDWGWLRILAAGYDAQLERRGYFYIGARELERLSGRQPRLMAKHDFSTYAYSWQEPQEPVYEQLEALCLLQLFSSTIAP